MCHLLLLHYLSLVIAAAWKDLYFAFALYNKFYYSKYKLLQK